MNKLNGTEKVMEAVTGDRKQRNSRIHYLDCLFMGSLLYVYA